MRRAWCHLCVGLIVGILIGNGGGLSPAHAAEDAAKTIRGSVQNQDLRRVGQVVVEVKDQEGTVVTTGVTNDAGEFTASVPVAGTYSVSAVQDTYRSEYVVLQIGTEAPRPVALTLAKTREIALEVV